MRLALFGTPQVQKLPRSACGLFPLAGFFVCVDLVLQFLGLGRVRADERSRMSRLFGRWRRVTDDCAVRAKEKRRDCQKACCTRPASHGRALRYLARLSLFASRSVHFFSSTGNAQASMIVRLLSWRNQFTRAERPLCSPSIRAPLPRNRPARSNGNVSSSAP